MNTKERNMQTCLFVIASTLLRVKLENGIKVRKNDLPDIINQVYEAVDYKGKEIDKQRLLETLTLQLMRYLTYNNTERKVYKVSNRDHLVLAIFDTLNEAREFADDYRAAFNLKLPNDVYINVNILD